MKNSKKIKINPTDSEVSACYVKFQAFRSRINLKLHIV